MWAATMASCCLEQISRLRTEPELFIGSEGLRGSECGSFSLAKPTRIDEALDPVADGALVEAVVGAPLVWSSGSSAC